MNVGRMIVGAAIGITFILCSFQHVGGEITDASVHISLPGEQQRERFGRTVFVASVWNFVNISIGELSFNEIKVLLYKGSSIPIDKDETNYYEWSFDGLNWRDLVDYGTVEHIDTERCKYEDGVVSFCVATDNFIQNINPTMADYENWSLSIKVDNNTVVTIPVVVEEPYTSLAATRYDYFLRVDPFTVTTLSPDQRFLTENKGNLPLLITINYTKFGDRITTSNFNVILHPYDTLEHDMAIVTDAWRPGKVTVGGTVSGTIPEYILPTSKESQLTIELTPAPQLSPVPYIEITVGHGGYEIEEIGEEVTFQYKKHIEAETGEKFDVVAYLCGNANVTISLSTMNISIESVLFNGSEMKEFSNISASITNSTEYPLVVSLIAPDQPTEALLTYEIKVGETVKTYTTTITIKEKTTEESQENPLFSRIIIGISIIVAIAYAIYMYVKRRGGK